MYSDFVGSLPDGLDSFPDYVSKASLLQNAVMNKRLPTLLPPGIDPRIAALIDDPPPVSTWMPTVHLFSTLFALAEIHGFDRQGYIDWQAALAHDLYQKPIYRFMMLVASPERLFRGLAGRWSQFHRGIENNLLDNGEGFFVGELVAPSELMQMGHAEAFLAAFRVAVQSSGGKNVDAHLLGEKPLSKNGGRVSYRLEWS